MIILRAYHIIITIACRIHSVAESIIEPIYFCTKSHMHPYIKLLIYQALLKNKAMKASANTPRVDDHPHDQLSEIASV